MNTPICDFVQAYAKKNAIRLHMPGHKGVPHLGPEPLDITEITGADVLYHAGGVIRQSEKNAASLFGSAKTLYSAEGSSLCIRAMLYLIQCAAVRRGIRPLVVAARNAHKTFITAAALLDVEIKWLYSREGELFSCRFAPDELEEMILRNHPSAVYITSPDYLGNICDIRAVSDICRRHKVILAVDNAHGAYLNFLPVSRHPLSLGADICCDSAHKTLPVLTGGAYLHIAASAPPLFSEQAEAALSLFASTSPSYLILQSLNMANSLLEKQLPADLRRIAAETALLKKALADYGFSLVGDEPLKLTLAPKSFGYTGSRLAAYLEERNIFCEFCDPDFLVMMFSSETKKEHIDILKSTLLSLPRKAPISELPPTLRPAEAVLSPHDAIMLPNRLTPVEQAEGKILASVSVTCPPAVPIAICGERINASAAECFAYYGIDYCLTVDDDACDNHSF